MRDTIVEDLTCDVAALEQLPVLDIGMVVFVAERELHDVPEVFRCRRGAQRELGKGRVWLRVVVGHCRC